MEPIWSSPAIIGAKKLEKNLDFTFLQVREMFRDLFNLTKYFKFSYLLFSEILEILVATVFSFLSKLPKFDLRSVVGKNIEL